LSGQHDVQQLCRELRVSRSGYYAWCLRQRQPSARTAANEQLRGQIVRVHAEHHGVYGSPRMRLALRALGVSCGRYRVARLMRVSGLCGRQRRRFRVRTTDSNHAHPIAPNHLLQVAHPQQCDRVWVTDITYVQTAAGWLYLAAVMDLCSRRVLGWATATTLETTLVLTALEQAIAARRPAPGVLVHSDRGVQYASTPYRTALTRHGCIASMSRRANCYDNAVMESFWSTLKLEHLFRRRFLDAADAHRAIFHYIEGFYNTRRLHSALGYRTPLDFESVSN
jgi:transposase InsO family protein